VNAINKGANNAVPKSYPKQRSAEPDVGNKHRLIAPYENHAIVGESASMDITNRRADCVLINWTVSPTKYAEVIKAIAATQNKVGPISSTYNVPTIARAATSGSSALVIGRPTTSTEAPSSRACLGVTARF
jgi:hypothetical protein